MKPEPIKALRTVPVRVDGDLHRRLKVRLAEEEVSAQAVFAYLARAWVEGRISIPRDLGAVDGAL